MNKKEILDGYKPWEKFTAKSVDGNTVRCQKEDDGNVFVYAKGKSRYGHRLSEVCFLMHYQPNPPKDETVSWHKRLKRAIACMTRSGLWPDIRKLFESSLSMTWEDVLDIRSLTDRRWRADGTRLSKEEMDQLCLPYSQKYPFAFDKDKDGHIYVNGSFAGEEIACRLKSMYFGKGNTDIVKAQIQNALEERKNYSGRYRTSYDVSVEYNAEKNKAWYSEEYKDCGNGHYYLALDNSTALFCEND